MSLSPDQIPVIAGVGEITDRSRDCTPAMEPLRLMAEAAHRADGEARGLLRDVDSIDIARSLLQPGLFEADGKMLDEVYDYASFRQSKMFKEGVSCSDCHDPHTQKLRAPGNTVCAQCHDASKYDASTHHRHQQGAAGAQCADCHMPRVTYMVVDPRRDHSLRVPRPDESVTLGVPNACNSCHTDRDAKWAATVVRDWLGRDAAGYQSFASVFRAAESGEPSALDRLAGVAADMAQQQSGRVGTPSANSCCHPRPVFRDAGHRGGEYPATNRGNHRIRNPTQHRGNRLFTVESHRF